MIFSLLKKAAGDSLNKYSGNRDFLEAICAASAMVASADGDVSDDEVSAAIENISNNEKLKASYRQSEIEEVAERMLKRAKTASGRAQLVRELEDIGSKGIELREDVFLAALDVAQASGDVDHKEAEALRKIAQRLGVDASKFF